MTRQNNRQTLAGALSASAVLADVGELAQAREVVQRALEVIEASCSYQMAVTSARAGTSEGGEGEEHPTESAAMPMSASPCDFDIAAASVVLAQELRDLLVHSLASQHSYSSTGGRAMLYESSHTFTRQRSSYTREGHSNMHQSSHSMILQRQASISRASTDCM